MITSIIISNAPRFIYVFFLVYCSISSNTLSYCAITNPLSFRLQASFFPGIFAFKNEGKNSGLLKGDESCQTWSSFGKEAICVSALHFIVIIFFLFQSRNLLISAAAVESNPRKKTGKWKNFFLQLIKLIVIVWFTTIALIFLTHTFIFKLNCQIDFLVCYSCSTGTGNAECSTHVWAVISISLAH